MTFFFPDPFYGFGFVSPLNTATATARQASVQQAPATGLLQKVMVPISNADGQSSLRVRLEQEAGSASSWSGTLLAAGAEGVIPSATNGIHEVTLTTPVAVTRGQKLIIVALYENYVTQVSFPRLYQLRNQYPGGFPYNAMSTTSNSASRLNTCPGTLLMIDGVWCPQREVIPVTGTTQGTLNPTGTYDEGGSRFTIPFGGEVVGCWLSQPANSGGYEAVLYDSSDNVLASAPGLLEIGTSGVVFLDFPEPVTVDAGADLRVTMKAVTGSSSLRWATTDTADHGAFLPTTLTRRLAGGAWTDDPLAAGCAGLTLSTVTGSGGGSAPSNRKVKTGGVFVDI